MKRIDIAPAPPPDPTSPTPRSTGHRSHGWPDVERATRQNGLALSPAATQCFTLQTGTVCERLDDLRATFEKNRHRYAFRRRAAIDEMFVLAATELHVNALGETLEAWLPHIESFEYPAATFLHAMAA